MSAAPVRRSPGRPRSEACRSAILEATADLLEEVSYSRVTIESVAARAHVSKQTIYKWWKSRAFLAMQAYAFRSEQRSPFPETGDVRADLLVVYRSTCRFLRSRRYRETVAGLIAEAQSTPGLADEFRETFIGARRALVIALLQRGWSAASCDWHRPVFVVDALYGPSGTGYSSGTPRSTTRSPPRWWTTLAALRA